MPNLWQVSKAIFPHAGNMSRQNIAGPGINVAALPFRNIRHVLFSMFL